MKRIGKLYLWWATTPTDVHRWVQPAWNGYGQRPRYRGGFAIKIGRRRLFGVTWG